MALEARRRHVIAFSACKLPVGTTTLGLLHRPICLDLRLAIRAIFRSRGPDNLPPQRDELKREYDRGPNDICVRQVTALCWVHAWLLRRDCQLWELEEHSLTRVAARSSGRHAWRRPQHAGVCGQTR